MCYGDQGYGKLNYQKLRERFPAIQLVHGETHLEVHKRLREQSRTEFYYLIMPNTEIFDTFNFDYSFEFGLDKENQKVVVWQKQNPVTGLLREYHGVGLFPKEGPMFQEKQYAIFNFRKQAVYEKDPICKDLKFPVIRTNDLLDLENHECDSDMYWLVHNDVEEFQDDFYPFIYDRNFIHNFNVKTASGNIVRNGVRLVPKNSDEELQKDVDKVVGTVKQLEIVEARTVEEAVEKANDYSFWMVNPDLKQIGKITKEFYPDLYDYGPTHIWKFKSRAGKDLGYGGVALSNKDYHPDDIILHDDYASRIPDKHNIKKYYTRDPYKAFKQAKDRVFYWVVDTAVELRDDFNFDYYPDIYSIENVFAFKSEEGGEAGVYLVHRPHLEKFNPSEEDFSFDRFKNIIRVDKFASRVVGHPAFYFDEGMYKETAKYFHEHKNIDVIDASNGLSDAYQKAAKMTKTGYFWAVSNDCELKQDFNKTFYVDRHHKSHFHLWPKENPYTGYVHQYGGLCLIPTAALKELKPDDDKIRKMNFKNKKPVKSKTASSRDIPFDVVFLSYREKEAEENYK